MFQRNDRVRSILSTLLSTALVATSIPGSAAPFPTTTLLPVPAKLGTITDSFTPNGAHARPAVILIQDLHLHYPTQKRILGLLQHLDQQGLLSSRIGVEGVQGTYDTTVLAKEPAGKDKDWLVDYFLRKGELSADEAFSVLKGDGRILFGIDDAAFYDLNVELFRKTLADRKSLEARLEPVLGSLDRLKRKHFTSELKRLDRDEADGLIEPKVALQAKSAAAKDSFTQNLVQADHFLRLARRLLRQEVTLEEAAHLRQNLSAELRAFKALGFSESVASIEETLRAASDFYTVAVMRDEPLATGTLELRRTEPGDKSVTAIIGGFHTAAITRALKREGVSYAVITPRLESVEDGYHALYESRLAGVPVSDEELRRDWKSREITNVPSLRAVRRLSDFFKPDSAGLRRWYWARAQIARSSRGQVRSLPTKTAVDLDVRSLLEHNDDQLTNLGDTRIELVNDRLKLVGLHMPPPVNAANGSKPSAPPVTPNAAYLASIFQQIGLLAGHPVYADKPGERRRVQDHLVTPIIGRIKAHYVEFGRSPRFIVSRDPALRAAQVPFVEVYDEFGLIIVANGWFIDDAISAFKNHGKSDLENAAALVAYVGEKLRHALRHKFAAPRDGADWEIDEMAVLSDDAQDQYYLTKSNGHSSFYQTIIDKMLKAHPFDSVRTSFLFSREGILAKIQQTRAYGSDFVFNFVKSLPKTLGLRSFPNGARTFQDEILSAHVPNSHPILRRATHVEIESEGYIVDAAVQETAEAYAAKLVHAHALAAFEAWRFAAAAHKVGKFADAVATDALTRAYNAMPFTLETQAAEGARDGAATVVGRYGLPAFFGLQNEPDLSYANDPVEITERLQRRNYLASSTIASYAMRNIYRRKGLTPPTLRLPDQGYLMGVAGPKGSGVEVGLEPSQFVRINIGRVAAFRNKRPDQVRVTGLLIRERHLQLINDTAKVLGLRRSSLTQDLQSYFSTDDQGILRISDLKGLKQHVKSNRKGMITLSNGFGANEGSLTLLTDGDPMPVFDVALGRADIAYGAGGVAESMIKARANYDAIDFQGVFISYLATMDGKPDALQAIDPHARDLRRERTPEGEIDEMQLATKAGMKVENGRVASIFTLEDLTGGPYSFSIIGTTLGDPETKEANFYPGLREVEVLEEGRRVRVVLLVTFPGGRRSLVRITYETGVPDQLDALANVQQARAIDVMTSIGRLYGDLRLYASAEKWFRAAKQEAEIPSDRLNGMVEFYRGMKTLLDSERPDIPKAQGHFRSALHHGHHQAQLMLEVMEFGKPKTVVPARLVNAIDSVVKATEEGRERAIAHLVDSVREAEREHLWTIGYYLESMAALDVMRWANGKARDTMDRVLMAAVANRQIGNDLVNIIRRVVDSPQTTHFFRQAVERVLDEKPRGSLFMQASLALLSFSFLTPKVAAPIGQRLYESNIRPALEWMYANPAFSWTLGLMAAAGIVLLLIQRIRRTISSRAAARSQQRALDLQTEAQVAKASDAVVEPVAELADSSAFLGLLQSGASRWWKTPAERSRVAAAAQAAKRRIKEAA
jgi:fructose-1,6-bisphosphatase/sedoheptulose 1,7-bisphosphatase-like protein